MTVSVTLVSTCSTAFFFYGVEQLYTLCSMKTRIESYRGYLHDAWISAMLLDYPRETKKKKKTKKKEKDFRIISLRP